ncbi:hypothetical protein [Alterisphingorhabdus coralli]|uniref:Autotransporter adhesin n=1 Tax=Alterisphingorhabdus coralli TaxID=3071408 RepID=A0AA97F4C0_9SPHN|nr:hypothetical protein [Parasphingorhabdus sp. SCSIO 66989]WOE74021.1 hypothetical protein RB602_09110 [Parasphingorhabdus sp. SCSIO 66989]
MRKVVNGDSLNGSDSHIPYNQDRGGRVVKTHWGAGSYAPTMRFFGGLMSGASATSMALAAMFAGTMMVVPGETALANTIPSNGNCVSGPGTQVGNEPGGSPPTTGNAVDGSGTYATVAGCGADGNNTLASTVFGSLAEVTGTGGVAIGFSTTAERWSTALGLQADANAGGVALGFSARALGTNSVSIGSANGDGTTPLSRADSTTATGANAIAIGSNGVRGAQAVGNDTIAIGGESEALDLGSIAIGDNSRSASLNSVTLGVDTNATGQNAISMGTDALTDGANAVALGGFTDAVGNFAVAIGSDAQALNDRAIAVGRLAQATGVRSIAVGFDAQSTNENAIAVGNESRASGNTSSAFGWQAQAGDNIATAIGDRANAAGFASTSVGGQSSAAGGNASAFGAGSSASGDDSTAIGWRTTASGEASAAVGDRSRATGVRAIAIGGDGDLDNSTGDLAGSGNPLQIGAEALADDAIAIGTDSVANATASIAMGQGALAQGASSIALGDGASVDAAGGNSVAIGAAASANGGNGVAIGNLANSVNNSVAVGDGARSGALGVSVGAGASTVTGASVMIGNNAGNSFGGGTAFLGIGIGQDAARFVNGSNNIGVGTNTGANVTGDDNVAIGNGAGDAITASRTVSIGQDAQANEDDAIAIGSEARALGASSTAIGDGAIAFGSTSSGAGAQAGGDGTAIGEDSRAGVVTAGGATDGSTNGTALGRGAVANGTNFTTALGDGAVADTADGNVALGAGATTTSAAGTQYIVGGTQPDAQVSVGGGAFATRRITNVAAGSAPTDAVNVSQLSTQTEALDGFISPTNDLFDANGVPTATGNVVTVDIGGTSTNFGSVEEAVQAVANASGGDSQFVTEDFANSDAPSATGVDSSAGGDNANAAGDRALALGHDSSAAGLESVALGDAAVADGNGSVAIGDAADAGGNNSVAIGNESDTGINGVGIGNDADATGGQSVAIGANADASGGNGIAIGNNADSNTGNSIAIGNSSGATANSAVAIGNGSSATQGSAIALGNGANAGVAVGDVALGSGSSTVAVNNVGYGGVANTATSAVAVGNRQIQGVAAGTLGTDAVNVSQLQAQGDNLNSVIGQTVINADGTYTDPTFTVGGNNFNNITDALTEVENVGTRYFQANSTDPDATAAGNDSVAIGPNAVANGNNSLAAGNGANAALNNTLALGNGASANNQNGDVAIGAGSDTAAVGGLSYGTQAAAPGSVVAFGNRRLQGVSDGVNGTDAVNVNQLQNSNEALDRFISPSQNLFDDATGAPTPGPVIDVAGTTYNSVEEAVNAVATTAANVPFTSNQGAGLSTAPVSNGNNSTAGGFRANAGGNNATAIGVDADTGNNEDATALGQGATVNGQNGTALGQNASADQAGLAVGTDASANGLGATALGRNANAQYADSIAIGTNSATSGSVPTVAGYGTGNAAPASEASFGTAGDERRLTNVADGAALTDAATVGQLVNQASDINTLVGQTVFDAAGVFTAPTFVTPNGGTAGNISDAFQAVTTQVDTNTTNIANITNGTTQLPYFKANSTLPGDADAQATGADAVAIGTRSLADSEQAVAIGDGATASDVFGIAIGAQAQVSGGGGQAIAIGQTAEAVNARALAVGTQARAGGTDSIAIGSFAGFGTGTGSSDTVYVGGSAGQNASGAGSVGIGSLAGTESNGVFNTAVGRSSGQRVNGSQNAGFGYLAGNDVTGPSNVAMGTLTGNSVVGQSNTALGNGAGTTVTGSWNFAGGGFAGTLVEGDSNVAIGLGAGTGTSATDLLTASRTISIGERSRASSDDGIAIGTAAVGSALNTIAIGNTAAATSDGAVAIGQNATAQNGQAVSIGVANIADGDGAVAIGDPNLATGTGAVALGADNTATGDGATAIGDTNTAIGLGSVALGSNAQANSGGAAGDVGAVALGDQANAQYANSVALGSGSATSADLGTLQGGVAYNPATGTLAGVTPAGEVSVGSAGNERRVTNVAAGSAGTDAVNVSQLQSLADSVTAGAGSQFVTEDFAGSTAPVASGTNASAGGDGAVASGNSSLALGEGATASETRAIALGADGDENGGPDDLLAATASGVDSIAIGTDTTASGEDGVAIGRFASATAEGATAVGSESLASAAGASAFGDDANAQADFSTALGDGAEVSGAASVGAVAIGADSVVTDALSAIAIGSATSATGDLATALGTLATATNLQATALGAGADATADQATAIGASAVASGDSAVAIGGAGLLDPNTTASGVNSVALGTGAQATNDDAVALGTDSVTAAANATANTTIAGTTYNFAGDAPTSVVSVGSVGNERQVTNVAAGQITATSTDAINGSQLFATNQAVEQLATGAVGPFVSENAAGDPAPSNTGTDAVAGGFGAEANADQATAVGNDATATGAGATAIGFDADAGQNSAVLGASASAGTNAVSVGRGTTANANATTAIGADAVASYERSVAIGAGSQTGGAAPTDAAYATSAAAPDSEVSFGTAGNERRLTNVAAGAAPTDAVNVSQLDQQTQAIDDLLSGDDLFDADGTPTGNGFDYDGPTAVADGTVQTVFDNITTDITNIANGDVGLVQQAGIPGAGNANPITVGAATGGNLVDFTGADGARTLSGVADAVDADDAITAGQAQTIVNDASAAIGGGAAYDVLTGAGTLPTISVGGTATPQSVADAANAQDAIVVQQGNTTAASFGGASTYDAATGTVSASIDYDGNTFTNVQDVVNSIDTSITSGAGSQFVTEGYDQTTNAPTASGTAASAGGQNALAEGNGSLAFGVGAEVTDTTGGATSVGSIAIGQGSTVNDAPLSIALGQGNTINGGNGSVIGAGNTLNANNVVSVVASTSTVSDSERVAVFGTGATVSNVTDATVFGSGNTVSTVEGGFIAADSEVSDSSDVLAIGRGNSAITNAQNLGVIGSGNTIGDEVSDTVVFGDGGTVADGTEGGVLIGSGGSVDSSSVAIGSLANASMGSGVAIGAQSAAGNESIAIGQDSDATQASSIAIGTESGANTEAVALGINANAVNAGDVALGANSVTAAAVDTPNTTLAGTTYTFAGSSAGAGAPTSVVSVGAAGAERQVTNVAAGQITATSTDAINGSQLFATNQAVEQLASGAVGPFVSENAAGDPAPSNIGTDAVAGGFGAMADADRATAVGNDSRAGVEGTAFGFGAAAAEDAVAVGNIASAGGRSTIAIGSNSFADDDDSISIGRNASSPGIQSVALGADTNAAPTAVAVGFNANATAVNDVALGANSITAAAVGVTDATVGNTTFGGFAGTTPGSVVSVGAVGAERQVTNVAAGQITATSTDAINGSQLFSVATVVDQIASGATGPFQSDDTAAAGDPTVGGANASAGGFGATADGDASTVLGNSASDNAVANSTVLGNGASVAAGTAGSNVALGQGTAASRGEQTNYTGYGLYTPGTGAPLGTESSVGEVAVGDAVGGNRQITGVASGTDANDAVNVSQLNAVAQAGAEVLGGGAAVDPTTGATTAPTFTVGNVDSNTVADAITAADDKADLQGTTLAGDILGGDVTYDPDTGAFAGGLDYTAQTTAGTNVDDGTVQEVFDEIGNDVGQNRTDITNILNGDVGLVQQAGVPGAGNANPITVGVATGGTVVDFTGTDGERTLSGVAGGTAGTDAVNIDQAQAAADAGAATFGGGAAFDVATGVATAPTFTVGNVDSDNVADAITAADDKADQTGGDTATAFGGTSTYDPDTGALVAGLEYDGTTETSVQDVITNIEGDITSITNGDVGLVQQVGVPGPGNANPITVGAQTGGTQVDFTGTDGERTLSGVAGGTAGTDAVNIDQAQAAADAGAATFGGGAAFDVATGVATAPTFTVGNVDSDNVADAITAADDKADQTGGDTATAFGGASTYDPDTGALVAAIDYDGNTFTNVQDVVTNIEGDITNVTNGTAGPFRSENAAMDAEPSNTGTDAVAGGFGSQANANEATAIGNDALANAEGATALGFGAQATGAGDLALGSGTVTAASTDASYGTAEAAPTNGVASVGGRRIQGVAAGAADDEAVNVAQLRNQGDAINEVIGQDVINPDGTTTPPVFTTPDGTTAGDVTTAIENITTSVDNNSTEITNLTNGTTGLVRQTGGAPGNGDITVGEATGGTVVDFTGTDGARQLTGLANGNVAAGSTDAVTGDQLFGVGSNINDFLGTGDVFDGTAPVFNVPNGGTESSVADAFDQITDQVDGNTTNIANNTTAIENINNGTTGLVRQVGGAPGGGLITVGAETEGTEISLANSNAEDRTLSGVADGEISDTSNQAVNGSQLFETNENVAGNTTAIENLDNRVTTNETNIAGNTTAIENLDDRVTTNETNIAGNTTAIENLDGRVTTNETNIAGNTTAINNLDNRVTDNRTDIDNLVNGTAGLVQQDPTTRDITVGADTDGTRVDLTNNAGETRTVAGVSDGLIAADSTEAVNGSQLFATNEKVTQNMMDIAANHVKIQGNSDAINDLNNTAVRYDTDMNGDPINSITLGQSAGLDGPVIIRNVATGVADTDAVNVGQLNNALAQANGYTDAQVGLLRDEVNNRFAQVDFDLNRLRNDMDAGLAGAAAMAAIPDSQNPNKVMFGGGVGVRNGQAGFAVGASFRSDDDRATFNLRAGWDNDFTAAAGFGVEF